MDKIQKIFDEINKKSGQKIGFIGERKEITAITTGVENLDFDIGCGGYPRGRIIEIFGREGASKTSLSLHGIAQAQAAGLSCLFVDAENTLDFDLAESLGVDINKLAIVYPSYGEEAIETIEKLLLQGAVDYIVIDSIPSLRPLSELEADVNKPNFGGLAKMWSAAVYRLVPLLARQQAIMILINQVRANMMGGQFDPFVTPGGHAIKFHASVRLQISKKGVIKGEGGDTIGYQVGYKVKKTKMSKYNNEDTMNYFFGKGFEGQPDLLSIGLRANLIERSGNTYLYNGEKIAIGKEKALDAILQNPELSQVIKDSL